MSYMDALAIFEMAVELFAFSFFTRFSRFYFENGTFRRNRQEQP